MTIILSIKVQDGVVLASDSAVLHRGHLYTNADKTIQLIKGLPIGVLISGDGAVGTRALSCRPSFLRPRRPAFRQSEAP